LKLSEKSPEFQSTHPRGVRLWFLFFFLFFNGFQSTHPRGVRRHPRQYLPHTPQRFNPRTREGCDLLRRKGNSGITSFNPRTREGCDSAWYSPGLCPSCFNPRTREGCDSLAGFDEIHQLQFQSTHPRGVRRTLPRARCRMVQVSIHAPARGATGQKSNRRAPC